MKKILVFLMALLSAGTIANAATKYNIDNYNSLSITEALTDEGITFDENDYVTNKNQVVIYMFRGKGCGYCKRFLNYVNDTLNKEYGEIFTIKTFEVWYDSANSNLMETVATAYGDSADGVPYIIIGDKSFGGYAESMNESIVDAIKTLYDTDKDERVDMFKKINGEKVKRKINKKANAILLVGSALIIVAAVVLYKSSSKKYNDEENEETEVEEKKEEPKKTTAKKTTAKKTNATKTTSTAKKKPSTKTKKK